MRIAVILALTFALASCDKIKSTSPTQAAYNTMARGELKSFKEHSRYYYSKHGTLPGGVEASGYKSHPDVTVRVTGHSPWTAISYHREGTKTFTITEQDLMNP